MPPSATKSNRSCCACAVEARNVQGATTGVSSPLNNAATQPPPAPPKPTSPMLLRRQATAARSRLTAFGNSRRHGSGGGGASGWSLLEHPRGPDKGRMANVDLTGPPVVGQVTGDMVGMSGWLKYYVVGMVGLLFMQNTIDVNEARRAKFAAIGHVPDHGAHDPDEEPDEKDLSEPRYGGALTSVQKAH